jgi:chorismate mutase
MNIPPFHLALQNENGSGMETKNLQALRSEIDHCDKKLMALLARRMDIVKQMHKYKKAHGMAAHQPERWHELMRTRRGYAKKLGIDAGLGERFIGFLHNEALQYQSGQD